MANYEDDDLDEVDSNAAQPEETEPAAAGGNRNFLLALGVLGGIFLLLIIALVVLFFSRRGGAGDTANIQLTNEAIFAANTQTAGAATLLAAQLLTPSSTPQPTNTLQPTRTRVVAEATVTNTVSAQAAALFTATPSATIIGASATPAAQTQAALQTRTQAINLTATATRLPQSGFAEDVGLPGLFAMALGLVLVIVLVRRMRLSAG